MQSRIATALTNSTARLLALRHDDGHWEGELSSSALSTATAVMALHGVDAAAHEAWIQAGSAWLMQHQNPDGGWGDTTISRSNLSTTLLCWSALRHVLGAEASSPMATAVIQRAEAWIVAQVGSLKPADIAQAVIGRYGKDKTFSVPILMLCTIAGTMEDEPTRSSGSPRQGWKRVLPLPFELAALPRAWFGLIGLPVVSYALPALIAIGYTRFRNHPLAWWHPWGWLRAALWPRISPMLKALQPSSGGYLEATPLTSFVTMALAAAGEKDHACVPGAVAFLTRSMRADGSWPIDTNLATWGTTLATKALGEMTAETRRWLCAQQYREVHPFTLAAPGGWAWTDLPGGVPDADDTAGALVALHQETVGEVDLKAVEQGIGWLLDLQNRDGGMPTFCRGWGTLPFDRSSPELTAHALLAWWRWEPLLSVALQQRVRSATAAARRFLARRQGADGSWIPLWFGNEQAADENNPVYGTAMVLSYLSSCRALADQTIGLRKNAAAYLVQVQKPDGSFGGDAKAPSTIEETAVSLHALIQQGDGTREAALRACAWLLDATEDGTRFPAAPIGLYFARLWYHEQLYPMVWTVQALRAMQERR